MSSEVGRGELCELLTSPSSALAVSSADEEPPAGEQKCCTNSRRSNTCTRVEEPSVSALLGHE